jgi:hypothetical protein
MQVDLSDLTCNGRPQQPVPRKQLRGAASADDDVTDVRRAGHPERRARGGDWNRLPFATASRYPQPQLSH